MPIPTSSRLGRARVSSTIASRSAASRPSRRSPSSTISNTPWRTPWHVAAAARARSTTASLLQLIAAWATTRSTWLSMGERISSRGTPSPKRPSDSIDSMRDSPMDCTPDATQVRAISGMPRVTLLTPLTWIPWRASRSTRVVALCRRCSRWISSRGALKAARSWNCPTRETPAPPWPPGQREPGSPHR